LAVRAASELAVSDAVLAAGARVRLAPPTVRTVERAAGARAVLQALAEEAKAQGAPTEAELDEIRRERWVDLERPVAVRTTHAVVRSDKPERAAEARRVAEKLGAAIASVTTGEELIRLAKAFPAEGFEVRAEALPFVTADGRIFARTDQGLAARPGGFDPAFAKGAHAVAEVGKLSPLVQSTFGYHFILLEERMPGVSTPRAELAALLEPEVLARRASQRRRTLLEQLRTQVPVAVERAADDLTAKVQLGP
jgi:hypothetical protein